MSEFLEILLAFVGVMFVLALAAQSVQELLKAAFSIKGYTLLKAIKGLVRESVRAHGQWSIDAEAILQELTRRLHALGQGAFQAKKLRLDTLPAPKLKELLAGIDPSLVPGLPVERKTAKEVLAGIAAQAEQWYDLAVAPVDERYRRRMRALALLASALVVIPLNAGAGRIYDTVRSDTTVRQRVAAAVARYDSIAQASKDSQALAAGEPGAARANIDTVVTDSADLIAAAPATRPSAASGPRSSAEADRAALNDLLSESGALLAFQPPKGKDFRDPKWWFGILVSVIFVSLGAPFWHDLLETIFGLKSRLRGPTLPEAKQAETRMLNEAAAAPSSAIPSELQRAAERVIDERAAHLPLTP